MPRFSRVSAAREKAQLFLVPWNELLCSVIDAFYCYIEVQYIFANSQLRIQRDCRFITDIRLHENYRLDAPQLTS